MSKWSEQVSRISMVAQRAVSRAEPSDPSFLLDSLGFPLNEARQSASVCERVALLAAKSVASRYAEFFTIYRLKMGFVSNTLLRFRPDAVVVQESQVFASSWRRHVDSSGHLHGELDAVVDYANSTGTPLYVISDISSANRACVNRAVFFPNLRAERLQQELEYVPRIISTTQQVAIELVRSGVEK